MNDLAGKLAGVTAGKRQIGILAAQDGRRDGREVFGDDDGRGAGFLGGSGIFRIRDKCDLAGGGIFDAGNAGDFDVRRTVFETRGGGGSDL